MDKYLYLSEYSIIYSFILFVILSVFLIKISQKIILKDKFTTFMILFIYFYYYIFLLLDLYLDFIPFTPDSTKFMKIIHATNDPYLGGLLGYYFVSFPARVLSLFDPFSFLIIQIFIYLFGTILLWKSWLLVSVFENRLLRYTQQRVFFVLVALWPAGLLFNINILREAFSILFLSIFFYSLSKYYKKLYRKFSFLVGLIGAIAIRKQFLVLFPPLLFMLQRIRIYKKIILMFALVLILYFITDLLGYKITPKGLEYLRNYRGEMAHSYGFVQWNSYFDILYDLPGLILQFMYAPLPILVTNNPLNMFMEFLDSLFVLFLTIFIFKYLKYFYINYKQYIYFIIISVLMLSIYEYYLTSAPRHRMPIVIVMMLLASYSIAKTIILYRSKKRKIVDANITYS